VRQLGDVLMLHSFARKVEFVITLCWHWDILLTVGGCIWGFYKIYDGISCCKVWVKSQRTYRRKDDDITGKIDASTWGGKKVNIETIQPEKDRHKSCVHLNKQQPDEQWPHETTINLQPVTKPPQDQHKP